MISCQLQKDNKIIKLIEDKKSFTNNTTISKKNTTILEKNTIVSENKKVTTSLNILKYVVGDPYFIDGVEYIPSENYSYNKIGLATY